MSDSYRTVSREAQIEWVVHRSRFLGYCAPAAEESEALALLEARRRAHRDASHHVYAYLLGAFAARYSDDGEPDGTAGLPSLEAIRHKGVRNLVVVTTRYFGGVLLGAGGLTRAYAAAASQAIEAAAPCLMQKTAVYLLRTPYPLYGKLERAMAQFGARQAEISYEADVLVRAHVRLCDAPRFEAEVREFSAGKLLAQPLGEAVFIAWPDAQPQS